MNTITLTDNLEKITSIDLGTSSPRLSGTINLVDIPNLVSLSGVGNDIEELLFSSKGFENLIMHDNKLSGLANKYIPLDAITISLDDNRLTSISSLSSYPNLQILKLAKNKLTGPFPSLNNNTALEDIRINGNSLTGPLPSLNNNTALSIFKLGSNSMSGSLPSLTANTELITFEGFSNSFTGYIPDLSFNTKLKGFFISGNSMSGPLSSLDNNTALVNYVVSENDFTGPIPSLDNNTAIVKLEVKNNDLTTFEGSTMPVSLLTFKANNNSLTEGAVNAILAATVAGGGINGTLYLGGNTDPLRTNAAPTGQGITDKATLIASGWDVQTN
tara:strand:+ start:644 stop:1633 length:990 start_codon:yes stop_codon:yes gene_type:complete